MPLTLYPPNATCSADTGHRPAIDNVFGKEWCLNLWRHEESHVCEQEDTHLDSPVIIGEVGLTSCCIWSSKSMSE